MSVSECVVSVIVYLLLCAIYNVQLELMVFYSIAITLSRLYLTDHEAVVGT